MSGRGHSFVTNLYTVDLFTSGFVQLLQNVHYYIQAELFDEYEIGREFSYTILRNLNIDGDDNIN